ncbi:hypothetical protein [uncultured Devosia sp.]|uniref:hypothetical protein n=1 Tax=uncultured Devosia sp. TaxID=211434 RepID=UPI0035CAE855
MSGRDLIRARRETMVSAKPQSQWGGLDVVLIVVAIMAVGACSYVGFGWMGSGPASAALIAASSDDLSWSVADEASCTAKARTTAASADASIEMTLADPAITSGGYSRIAKRVHCLATTKPMRFCDGQQRAVLVDAVMDYFHRTDLLIAGLQLQGMPINFYGNLLGGEASAGAGVYDLQMQSTFDYMKFFHDEIKADLRGLATAGLLNVGDFGVFMGMGASPMVVEILKDVKPGGRSCA